MGLSITSSGIVMTDGSGNVRFDTAEKLFIPTDFKTGSLALPNYSAVNFGGGSETTVDTETITTLTSISALATTVRGTAKFDQAMHGFSNSYVYNAGGSIVFNWLGGGFMSGPSVFCGNRGVTGARILTFFCDGGSLKLRDRIMIAAEYPSCLGVGSNTRTFVGPTVTYNLFCGTFV